MVMYFGYWRIALMLKAVHFCQFVKPIFHLTVRAITIRRLDCMWFHRNRFKCIL